MNNYVYTLDGKIYINLTNLCTNDCVFCIRAIKDDVVGANLFLDTEVLDINEVKKQLDGFEPDKYSEIIFCGYGEPILKLDALKEIAAYIKEKYPHIKNILVIPYKNQNQYKRTWQSYLQTQYCTGAQRYYRQRFNQF